LPRGKTQQFVITPNDGRPLAIAVIYERWVHDNGDELYTFVMVTTPHNSLIATITDRMPAIIQPEDWGKWLGEKECSTEELKALLKTQESEPAHPNESGWTMKPEKPAKLQDQPQLF
jgi:putative SOS response-associated peptidase YedK